MDLAARTTIPGTHNQAPARLAVEASSARTITVAGRELLFFGGCGYLALAHEPRVREALIAALGRHGISSGAARETTGNVVEHDALESEIAAALELESALLLPEGACANFALAESLEGEFDHAWIDADAHPSLSRAARIAGGSLQTYPNADARGLAERVRAAGPREAPVALWTDGVFPSAGKLAPIAELLACLPNDRGVLVVDDCHGFGVLGARGRGCLEHALVRDPRIVVSGTLSKALGVYGGFVAGSRARIARLRERSALYAGTTPLPPPLAAAARAALGIHVAEPARHAAYMERVQRFSARLAALGLAKKNLVFPVFAFDLGDARRNRALHESALALGVFLPLVRYGGPRAPEFFRVVWNAAHTAADLDQLEAALHHGLGAT